MPEPTQAKYKSPLRKIVKMLEGGRANWKEKHSAAKREIKYLQNRLRRVEQSQQAWKQKAQTLAEELRGLGARRAPQEAPEATDKKTP